MSLYLVTTAAQRVGSKEVLAAVPEESQEVLLALLALPETPGDDGVESEDPAAAQQEAERVRAAGLAGPELSLR